MPLLPWGRVDVEGPSMVPTLRPGDVLLVRHGARIAPGDVVIGRFRGWSDHVVKRALEPAGTGWALRSDNDLIEGDSRQHGPAEVVAKVVLVWPADRRGTWSWVPRRVR